MRPLKAIISLENLKKNYTFLKKLHGNKLIAVIKSDAYGHGAIACSKSLQDIADGFAVAFLEEALELRLAGIKTPIILLEGVFEKEEYKLVDDYNLSVIIHDKNQLNWFLEYNFRNKINVWLKLDSGMNRLGFNKADFLKAHQTLLKHSALNSIVKMSHLFFADEIDSIITEEQIRTFDFICNSLKGEESLANSAAILRFSKSHKDWGRAGISLYGLSPFLSNSLNTNDKHLKPVMSLKTKVFSIKNLNKGEGIGYGHIYKAPYDMRVGVIACGYADGYPRITNNNQILINGIKTNIIGRVSMDMITVELNHHSQQIGSEVELWGEMISVTEVANKAHTISYEILCHLKRAEKIYI